MTTTIEARGVVVRRPGEVPTVEPLRIEPPGPGEVRVRVLATGVCHSDLHAQRGHFGKEFPLLLGHEATGVIDAVGDGVDPAREGETVMLNWRAPCGRCRYCDRGRPAHCARPLTAQPRMFTQDGLALGRVLGLGTFATHTVVAAGQATAVSGALAPEATCLIGCCVATGVGAALQVGEVTAGHTVAVFGCGAVGTSVLQGARLAHAAKIIAVDLSPKKLAWAREFGATDVVDARAGDPVKQVRALTQGLGVDRAFEAVGLPETLSQALASCDLGGRCVMIGVPTPGAAMPLSLSRFFYQRADLRATFYGDCLPSRDFPILAELYRRGELRLDALITQRLGLGAVAEAFALMERGESLRAVLTP
jgi:S-(hydroxymethyl)mycothiol dehydrogenase